MPIMKTTNNYPTETDISDITSKCLKVAELSRSGKPKTASEWQQRIYDYFSLCSEIGLKPGAESMASACGVSRVTMWKLSQGSDDIAEVIRRAKGVLSSLLEAYVSENKMNVVWSIFSAKNNFDYVDRVELQPVADNRTQLKPIDQLLADIPDEEI